MSDGLMIAAPATPRFSGLVTRLISAAVLIPLVILWNVKGGIAFSLVLTLIAALMTVEWWRITWRTGFTIALAGFPYILLTAFCLQQMRMVNLPNFPDTGMWLVFATIGLLSLVDISAYVCGKSIGGRKLAPRLSPNKTWAGLLGAMACTAIAVALLQYTLPPLTVRFPIWFAMIIGAFLAILAQLGDLFESWLKRLAGVKDAGGLIPGHGGILDRADGYLTTVPLIWGWALWQGWL